MKSFNFLLFIFSLTITLETFGIDNDSIKQKSININPSFTIGDEYTLSSRIEYENSKWGKINLKGELGVTKGGLLFDLGLGYGYPLLYKNNNAIFVNGNITFINVGLKTVVYGPTSLFEFEYRKTWKNFSINVVPFYRRKFIQGNSSISYNDNSLGIRFGMLYSFRFKK